ncbi:unnamed protein product [Sympodiomycopsis kandeliae]
MSGSARPSGSSSSSSSSSSLTQTLLTYPTTQQGRVVIAALASCTITAASIFSYQAGVRLARRRKLAKDVDKATHRDEEIERKHHPGGASYGDGDTDSIDGGTPRYLDRLSHLGPSKSNNNLSRAAAASPLRRENSRQSIGRASSKNNAALNASPAAYDESLMREQLARNFAFLGDEAMSKLKDAFVIVVGLGGVGSHTALSLIRSGVGHVRLIDFDQVSLSSLNRHAVANLEDVGRPKVVVCQEHFKNIAPWVHIQAWVEIFNESEAPRLFSPFVVPGKTFGSSSGKEVPPTYVIDCIDNLNTKVGLLAYCHKSGIKIFSSMGASAKCDPTRICIGDLTATEEDPLAKSVRRRLRERGIPEAPPKEPDTTPNKKHKFRKAAAEKRAADKRGTGTSTPPRDDKNAASISSQNTPRPAQSSSFKTSPSEAAKTQGELRKPDAPDNRHRLSRASSASSFGSGEGAFYTPQGTPKEEEKDWDNHGVGSPAEFDLDQSSETIAAEDAEQHRPSLTHHSTSGLEVLDASPMTEKPGFNTSSTIESTPGFAPSVDGEQDEETVSPAQGEQIWKRESKRRQSESLLRSKSQGKRSGESAIAPVADGDEGGAEDADAEMKKKTPESEVKKPWTASNPRYLIPCIFSTEKPAVDLLPLDEAELAKDGGVEMLRALEDGNEWRVRVLPVLGPIPAIFGLSIATFVICDMSGRHDLMEPLQSKIKRRTAERTQKDLEHAERSHPSPGSVWDKAKGKPMHEIKGRGIPFRLDDILYLCHEVFHARSVVPPYTSLSGGCLLRWDSTLPISYHNVALFSRDEAKKHQEEVLKKGKSPVEVWGTEAAEMWRKRMKEERWYAKFR